jgi:prophage regulatory protein
MAKRPRNRETFQRESASNAPISAYKIVRKDMEEVNQRKDGNIATVVDRIVRLPELLGILSIGRSTLYVWMDAGKFPRSLKLGERARGWRLSVVLAFLNSLETEPENAE